jgi:hypothetical protein
MTQPLAAALAIALLVLVSHVDELLRARRAER